MSVCALAPPPPPAAPRVALSETCVYSLLNCRPISNPRLANTFSLEKNHLPIQAQPQVLAQAPPSRTPALQHALNAKRDSLYTGRKPIHYNPLDHPPRSASPPPSLCSSNSSISETSSLDTLHFSEISHNAHPLAEVVEDQFQFKLLAQQQSTHPLRHARFKSFLHDMKNSARSLYHHHHHHHHHHHENIVVEDPVPLETFQLTLSPIPQLPQYTPSHARKSRDCRINTNFLRFYAIDTSIREKHNLSNTNDPQILRFQSLSKHKMFNGILLPPREDEEVSTSYIARELHPNSIVKSSNRVLPWYNLTHCMEMNKKCLNPRGSLQNNVQYTVKNWENERWSSNSSL